MMSFAKSLFVLVSLITCSAAFAEIKVGSAAPDFTVKNFKGETFKLSDRKGQWTVLYFYPKADTPGCTKQACAFRDNISKIREQGAEVFGISVNSVADQSAFHEKHHLNFDLLADEDAVVTRLYGSNVPVIKMSKRWTYILDPALTIRSIDKDVDPILDPERSAKMLRSLKQ